MAAGFKDFPPAAAAVEEALKLQKCCFVVGDGAYLSTLKKQL